MGMPATTDTHMPTMALPTTESVRLMLSPRLMLTPIFCMVDMDMDTLDMPDTTDTHMLTMDLPTTERDLLMLSLRLMLILIFFMVDMDMDTLDIVDTTDTHMVDMPTTDKLWYQSHILLQKIDKTAINAFFFSKPFFSAWTLFWVK